jgi:hypothetical protein
MWGKRVILAVVLLALMSGYGCSRDSGDSKVGGTDTTSVFRNLGKR